LQKSSRFSGEFACMDLERRNYRDLDDLDDLDDREDLDLDDLLGTLLPAPRASERPIAIACLRLFTLFPDRPDLSLPRFIFVHSAANFLRCFASVLPSATFRRHQIFLR